MLTTALDFPKAGLGKSGSNQCSLRSRAQGVHSQLMGRRELELALPAEGTRGRLTGWESTRVVVGSHGVCRPGWDLGCSPSEGEAPRDVHRAYVWVPLRGPETPSTWKM